MTTTTPFLNLIEYDTVTDGSVLINDFITDTSGSEITSNVNRIDLYALNSSASVAFLMANPPPAYISATNISSSYYEGTNTNVSTYITNMMIILKLNVTTSASPSLKINALSTLNLMKTDSIGNTLAVSAGDLLGGKEYQFRYDGTQWVWVSATSQDQSGISGTPGNILNISTGSTVQDSTYGFGTATGVPLMTSGSIQQLNLGSGSTTNGSSILFDDRTWKSRMALPSIGITPLSAVNSLELRTTGGSTILAVLGNNVVLDYNAGNFIGTSGSQKLGFYGGGSSGSAIIRPTVTGSGGGSDVVISLVQALANLGLIINGTT
jgi:hypothetical protein